VVLPLGIPESLKKLTVDFAEREHRSVNQQIEFLLEQSIATAKKTSTVDKATRKPEEKREH